MRRLNMRPITLTFPSELINWGSGCSKVVECTPCNREVVDLNPVGCWAFSLLCPFSSVSLSQVPPGGATLLIFLLKKLSCAPRGKASLICMNRAKKSINFVDQLKFDEKIGRPAKCELQISKPKIEMHPKLFGFSSVKPKLLLSPTVRF